MIAPTTTDAQTEERRTVLIIEEDDVVREFLAVIWRRWRASSTTLGRPESGSSEALSGCVVDVVRVVGGGARAVVAPFSAERQSAWSSGSRPCCGSGPAAMA